MCSPIRVAESGSKMQILVFLSVLLGALGSEETAPGAAQQLRALHCPPCEQIHCSTRRALKLQCKGGVTTGICGCCPVCARVEGEACGGAWDYLGKCDKGLVCKYQDSSDKPDAERKGVCAAGEIHFTQCSHQFEHISSGKKQQQHLKQLHLLTMYWSYI